MGEQQPKSKRRKRVRNKQNRKREERMRAKFKKNMGKRYPKLKGK
jgi:hypothetical protein